MKYQNIEDDFALDLNYLDSPISIENFKLYQVGKKFCKPNTEIFSHTHIDWFELTVVIEGNGEVYANNKKATVSSGDIFISFPCDIHKIVASEKTPLKYSFISFSFNNNSYKHEFAQIVNNFYECEHRCFRNDNIPFLINLLIEELTSINFNYKEIISNILNQLTVFTIRKFLQSPVKTVSNHASKNELLCYKIMRYIDNNLFTIKSLTEISEHFHYNYTYIANLFMKTTNLTLKQYLSKCKLERAKVLIKEDKLNITEISNLLNYASIYSFSKSFKFHFNLSPAEYKRLNKRKN